MSIISAIPDRVQAQYLGRFREPAFGVLANPAGLYSNLVGHLRRFGASVNSLSVNLAVVSQASVVCHLDVGMVRVSLEQLEVFVRDVESESQISELLTAALRAMSETDTALVPVRHEATILTWARLEPESFSSYIRRFVTVPSGMTTRVKPTVEFVEYGESGTVVAALRMEEAATIPEGLYVRLSLDLGSGSADAARLLSEFTQKVDSQLNTLDLALVRQAK